MRDDQTLVPGIVISAETLGYSREFVPQSQRHRTKPGRGLNLRQLIGRAPIYLDLVESRILRFLASRPYRPLTRQRIADAVSTESHPVTEESVDRHVRSLRHQLGFFHDYVQTVRYIGYRFKA